MSRWKPLWINLLCWTCGMVILCAIFIGMDAVMADGYVKTVLQWVIAAIVVTFFGGVPFSSKEGDGRPTRHK